MHLTLGFSPCPNDTFIFDALVHQKIDTKQYTFDYIMEDVETLNQWALQNNLDITKMSFAASNLVLEQYSLLQSGSALGKGVGPLLISKRSIEAANLTPNSNNKIAIPGDKTTAHFLFKFYNKIKGEKIFMPFHQIENWILNEEKNENRFGVIIHENRFTYALKGLHKVQDLGAFWEEKTQLPIPLGGIFIKSLHQSIKEDIDQLIKASVEYAFKNYSTTLPEFIKNNAQEMSEDVMWQHIKLYVNHYSIQLGKDGNDAIVEMQKIMQTL